MSRTSSKKDLKRKAEAVEDLDKTDAENVQPQSNSTSNLTSTSMDTKTTNFSKDFALKVVGGHRLTNVRPVFTENDHLMVPDQHRVLFFNTKSKEITHALSPADEEDRITNVALHPYLSYFQVFAFSANGFVYLCNYLDATTTTKVQLPLVASGTDLDLSEKRSIAWGTCRNYQQTPDENHLVLFYAVYVQSESSDSSWFEVYSCPFNQPSEATFLYRTVIFSEQRISFGVDNRFLVFIERSRCFILLLDQGVPSAVSPEPVLLFKRKNKTHHRHYNGVVCSPTEHYFANSDEGGLIYLHYLDPDNLTGKHPKSLLHWHPMAVCDMTFSENGTFLYSVGNEGVVVRWNISTLQRNFCARVGYGIRFVATQGSDIAITLQNNIIRMITSHFSDLNHELSTLMYYENQDFSSGLVYNSKMNAIALNGRPGFVQFFNPLQPGQLQVLDVTQSNYVEPIGGVEKVFNIDVHRIATSPDGIWFATFELRDDSHNLPEMRLKFWRYHKFATRQAHLAKFDVHTIIHLPHKDRISQMKFAPTSRLFVTTGLDQQFKLWTAPTGSEKWQCVQTILLNASLRPIYVDFSSDSTALSVVYDSTVTIWNVAKVKELTLIDSIVYSAKETNVLGVHFGFKSCANLILVITDRNVILWELPKMSCIWTWTVESETIVKYTFDSVSNRLVLLDSSDRFVVMSLTPIGATVIGTLTLNNKLSAVEVDSILLFPHNCPEAFDTLFGRTMLCIFAKSRQMYAFTNENVNCAHFNRTAEVQEEKNSKQLQYTFSDALSRRKNVDGSSQPGKSETVKYAFSQLNTAKLIDEMFYNVPSHVLPPIEMLSKTFLQSLQVGGVPLEADHSTLTNQDSKLQTNENQEQSTFKQKVNHERIHLNMKPITCERSRSNDELKKFTFNENYSFLRKHF